MHLRMLILMMCVLGPVAYAGGDPIPVCVGADGTMRLVERRQKCASDEQRKLFAEWEEELSEPPEEEEAEDPIAKQREEKQKQAELEQMRALEQRVDALTKRLAALENAPGPRQQLVSANRVTAPFEVVSRSGSVILRVAEKVSSTTGNGAHVTIGAGDAGNYGVRVYKNGGTFIAGVGQAQTGSGLVTVMDDDGEIAALMSAQLRSVSVFKDEDAAASLTVDERGGTVAVYQDGEPVAYLTRSSHGNGGNLTLADGKGFGVFSAGSASDGGGEACLNRVTGGGKQRNVCLGIELPSMGLGK